MTASNSRRHRLTFLWVSAIAAAAIIVASRAVLLPFVLGLVVAFVLTPAVIWVEKYRVPRWAAILLTYAVTLGAAGGFIALIVPSLVQEGRALSHEIPKLTKTAQDQWLPALDERLTAWMGQEPVDNNTPSPVEPSLPPDLEPPAQLEITEDGAPLRLQPHPDGSIDVHIEEGLQFRRISEDLWRVEQVEHTQGISSENMLRRGFSKALEYVSQNSIEVIKLGQQVVGAVSRGVFNLFMTLMLGGYLIYTHERIIGFFRELWSPRRQPAFDRFVRRIDRGLAGVLRGQLLICCVNGVLSAIGFWLFDLKYWPILSIIAAIMSIIPIFGSILSTIPAVAIGLTQSPTTALAVLAWVVGIHQLEANFLNPKIIGDSAKIHPVLVVFSLLVGEHFFGIAGALFAVPCLSILQSVFLHFREVTLGGVNPTASIPPLFRTSEPAPDVVVGEPAEGPDLDDPAADEDEES